MIAILSLALGIGANTAIFSLLDQVVLRTLPVKNPQELVFFYSPGPTQGSYSADESGGPSFSYPLFRELQKAQTSFTGIAVGRTVGASLSYHNNPYSGAANAVSGNYFELLGVHPAIGRLLTADDDGNPGEHPVAVLSHDYWTAHLGSDPGVLNGTLSVNGYPMTIVGVAQQGFSGEKPGSTPDIYFPVTMIEQITPNRQRLTNRKVYWLSMFGRLKPGLTLAQAQAAINVPYHAQVEVDAQLLSRPSATLLARFQARTLVLKPGEYGRGDLRDSARQPAFLLISMTVLVLLIACANLANLQLARASARAREIAVRLAIGASRTQMIRALLAETCALSVAGGALGLAIAYATMNALVAAIPPSAEIGGVLSATLDTRTLLFCTGVSILTGLLFGLYPAIQTTRPNLSSALKNQTGQNTASATSNLFRKTLATAQVAMSLLLLVSAGLCAQTLVNLRRIDLGMRTDHLLMFSVAPKLNRYSDEATYQFFEQLTERLAAIPGVKLVSSGTTPPVAGNDMDTNVTVPGYTPPSDEASNSNYDDVGADYFRTMGIPLISGREFTVGDNAGSPKVAVVNEEFVRHFLPGQNAIGHRFAVGHGTPDIEIVGVIKDAKYSTLKEAPQRLFYLPHRQIKQTNLTAMYFYLRTAVDPEAVTGAVRRAVAGLDPNLPVGHIKTMENQIDEDLFAERLLSVLTVSFAALATVLAAIGLYGVLAFNVARRTREIGIRMALGADRSRVRGMIMQEVASMVLIGAAVGLVAALSAANLVGSLLYGLKPWDAPTYAGAALVVTVVAMVAAFVPAARATRVDPLIALRYE